MLGALTAGDVYVKIADSTKTDTVEEFMKEMHREKNLTGSIMVMDNHPAHHSGRVKQLAEELGCFLLFLPPASSIFNPIETLWAQVEWKWRNLLLSTPLERVNKDWMIASLYNIVNNFNEIELESLTRVHYKDAIDVLKEAAFIEDRVRRPMTWL